MNILPLVFSVLFVFALCAGALSRQKIATYWQERSFVGYMEAERLWRNKYEQVLYRKVVGPVKKPLKKDGEKQGSKKTKDFKSVRDKPGHYELGKLNIALLFEPLRNEKLVLLTAKLIDVLYGHASFFKEAKKNDPKLALTLVNVWSGHQRQSGGDFSEILPVSHPLQKIFSQMLRGTNQYQLDRHRGYPPLEDFMTIDEDRRRKPVVFPYASRPLLAALFGDSVAEKILEKERLTWEAKHRQNAVTKTQLREILFASSQQVEMAVVLDTLVGFTCQKKPLKTVLQQDSVTGITVRRAVGEESASTEALIVVKPE